MNVISRNYSVMSQSLKKQVIHLPAMNTADLFWACFNLET